MRGRRAAAAARVGHALRQLVHDALAGGAVLHKVRDLRVGKRVGLLACGERRAARGQRVLRRSMARVLRPRASKGATGSRKRWQRCEFAAELRRLRRRCACRRARALTAALGLRACAAGRRRDASRRRLGTRGAGQAICRVTTQRLLKMRHRQRARAMRDAPQRARLSPHLVDAVEGARVGRQWRVAGSFV